MGLEHVIEPEINLIKSNEFYLFYEMMMQSLKTDNVREGISKSLLLLRKFLCSGNVALFMKNEEGKYLLKDCDSIMMDKNNSINCIINQTHSLVEQKKILNLDLHLSESLQNIVLLNVKIDACDCILVIVNNEQKELEPLFWDRLSDTIQVILKRAVSYERNTKAITMDLLTGLDNRNSYERRIQSINELDENIVLGIFDLFRLKYVNDNYSHDTGDKYIKAAANILNKYWPKERKTVGEDGLEQYKPTGHTLYRVGGDGFILLTTSEELPLSLIKADLVARESEIISLGVEEGLPLGLNYGIVHHNPGNSIKNTIEKADTLMRQDKAKMYVKYNLERRR